MVSYSEVGSGDKSPSRSLMLHGKTYLVNEVPSHATTLRTPSRLSCSCSLLLRSKKRSPHVDVRNVTLCGEDSSLLTVTSSGQKSLRKHTFTNDFAYFAVL
jgi:hypothetical protein